MHKALYPSDDDDRLYESKKKKKKKEEEDLSVLKTALMHQYNDLNTTYKSVEKDWLKPPETIVITWGPTERQ